MPASSLAPTLTRAYLKTLLASSANACVVSSVEAMSIRRLMPRCSRKKKSRRLHPFRRWRVYRSEHAHAALRPLISEERTRSSWVIAQYVAPIADKGSK
jgi:hypothetical protein